MSYKVLHLDLDEHVVLEVRKHWIVFLGNALVMMFAAVLPVMVFLLLKFFVPPEIFNFHLYGKKYALFLFVYFLWLLFLWITFFVEWTKYYLDVWYVTEKRIIVVDQKNIFHREVSNLHFNKIQDVTLEVHGLLSTLLKFGSIRVQTASENSQEFFMNAVRYPEEVRRIIFSYQNKGSDVRPHTHI